MAALPDASSQGFVNGGTALTFSHATGSGSDRALYVFAVCHNSTDFLSGATVTYGGTSLGSPVGSAVNGGNAIYCWRMLAPPSGSASIVITPTGSAFLHAYAESLTGVDQTTPNGTPLGQFGNLGTPISQAVTLAAGGVAVDMLSRRVTGTSLTPGGSQTRIGTEISQGVATTGASYQAGAITMSWTHASTADISYLVVPVNAAAGASFTGAVTLDNAAPGGSFTTAPASSFAGAVTLDAASPGGSFGPAPGTFTSPPLSSNNGTVLASAALSYVAAYDASTGALVARFTGLSTDSLGRFTVSSPLLTTGATLRWDWEAAAGQRRMPLGVIA